MARTRVALSCSSVMQDEEVISDLSDRWRRARQSALRSVVPAEHGESELDWLRLALAEDADALHARVFENSLRLGVGFGRYHRRITLDELPAVLSRLASPCGAGTWSGDDDGHAARLVRGSCVVAALGPLACDYWREALNGLVLGLTGDVRHARHRSVGHGDAECVDVVYVDPESTLGFGPIPAELQAPLAEVARLARSFSGDAKLEFLGVSEGVLDYRLTNGHAGLVSVTSLVERALHRRIPQLALREVSPRAVFGDGNSDSGAPHEGKSIP